ncbi:hypothetical protein BDV59DRAFT_160433 [Aspergillus ambiguus]|uniref:GIY-YIG nuclease family protein n=1 Tax=Aspergillus ambiguus TaxID=176160 RepID=UPI003CCDAB8D
MSVSKTDLLRVPKESSDDGFFEASDNEDAEQSESGDTELDLPDADVTPSTKDIDLAGKESDDFPSPCTPCKKDEPVNRTPTTPDSGFADGGQLELVDVVKMSSPQTRLEVIREMCSVISKPISSNEHKSDGYAYVFSDPSDNADLYKLGQSTKVQKREDEYTKGKCKISGWETTIRPRVLAIRGHIHLEQLAHRQLANSNCSFTCNCGTSHREFFFGTKEAALPILDLWTEWLWQRPYDERGELKDFWKNRLSMMERKFLSAFCCQRDDCSSKEKRGPACAECLMKGWKVWTIPTFVDKLEYCKDRVSNDVLSGKIVSGWTRMPLVMIVVRIVLFALLFCASIVNTRTVYLSVCFLEGLLSLGLYKVLYQAPRPDNAKYTPMSEGSPKGPSSQLRGTWSSEKQSQSLARLRSSTPERGSPGSPSEKAAFRRMSARTGPNSRRSSASPSPGALQIRPPAQTEEEESAKKQGRKGRRKSNRI